MQWAKTQTSGKFSLAPSGVENYLLKDLPVSINDIELTGDSLYGYVPLLEALAEKCKVDSTSVVTAMGTSMANQLAMATILEPGDEILIEEPTYDPLLATARYLGVKINRFPRRFEDGFQINPSEVKKALTPKTKLIVLSNLHNPTGVFTPETTLLEIGEIAKGKAYVLVDEVYLGAMFEKAPLSAFHLGEHFITTNSLTKIYGLSGLRCGWILANPELTKKMWLLNDLFGVIAAHPAERLSVIALKNLDKIAQKYKDLLTKNHLIIRDFLDSRKDLSIVRPDFGTIYFPKLNSGSVREFSKILREKYETIIVPGEFFELKEHFRIGIGINSEILSKGLSNIALALDEIC
ncbi:MAG: pyridoxal phosphate-dependent aminotransferase [Acidobacteria bacterium]|nr:pyridoxal phosphate-dependent aminotransferase [Acidobacteriota bacterium]